MLRGVHFDFNKSKIRPGDAAVLDEAATTLKANPNVTVNVNGYCDAIGGENYNLKLSDRRADAVVDYLVKAGIPSSQLIPHGYGKTDFVATNDTAEGRAQNRRVELVPNEGAGPRLRSLQAAAVPFRAAAAFFCLAVTKPLRAPDNKCRIGASIDAASKRRQNYPRLISE